MALSGHCALKLGNKYTVVIGGGGKRFDKEIPVDKTGPEPTNHINIYDHQYNQWITTLNPITDERLDWHRKILPMRQARMNQACVSYKVGVQAKYCHSIV